MSASVYDILPDAVIVVDRHGVIVTANVQCEALLGYRAVDLAGCPVAQLVPERFSAHAGDMAAFLSDPTRRLMGRGRYQYARTRSGAEVPVDIALSPVPLDGDDHGVLAVMRDARARFAVEEQIRVQAVALEAAANGIVITDTRGIITWANRAASDMTGYELDELVGESSRILKSGVHDESFYRQLWETVTAGDVWVGEIINRRKDGRLYHEEQTIAPVRNHVGAISHFIAIKLDVTIRRTTEAELHQAHLELRDAHAELESRLEEIKQLTQRLAEQAIRDPLTNLFNRRFLDEALLRELSRAARHKEPLSAVLLDVDHFKLINDHFGHETGDQFLVALGDILRTHARTTDVACRFGGEEFVVIMPGASAEVAVRRANEWRKRFSEIVIDIEGKIPRCTLSGGVAAWNGPDESPASLLRRADEAMYNAKHAGRDCVVVDE